MKTPLSHSFRTSEEVFLGKMDKQATLWLFATWKFRGILFRGRRCGILEEHFADQHFITSTTACCHEESVSIVNIPLFGGHNSEQRQKETGGNSKDREVNSVSLLPTSSRYSFLTKGYIQGGARNVIPFYHPIKTVTSQCRSCKRLSECCSSWKMR